MSVAELNINVPYLTATMLVAVFMEAYEKAIVQALYIALHVPPQ